jgi:hypothetical protein
LVDVVNHEGSKQSDRVACNDIKIPVIQCDLDGPRVAARELSNGLDDISKVSGGYRASSVSVEDE